MRKPDNITSTFNNEISTSKSFDENFIRKNVCPWYFYIICANWRYDIQENMKTRYRVKHFAYFHGKECFDSSRLSLVFIKMCIKATNEFLILFSFMNISIYVFGGTQI